MALKLPGQVGLIGESQIKGDQRQLGIFGRNFVDRATEPLHREETLWCKPVDVLIRLCSVRTDRPT